MTSDEFTELYYSARKARLVDVKRWLREAGRKARTSGTRAGRADGFDAVKAISAALRSRFNR